MRNESFTPKTICQFASAASNKIAFSIFDGKFVLDISYGQFVNDILKTANYFSERKIVNQHIALLAPNSYDWVVSFFAIIASGNIAILMNPDLPADILHMQCAKADVSLVCGDKQVLLKLEPSIPTLFFEDLRTAQQPLHLDAIYCAAPDETIMMMFTSGTTGKNKVVEITSDILLYSMENYLDQYLLPGMDRILSPTPFYHVLALMHCIESLYCLRTVCMGRGIKYLFMDMAALNPTTLNAVPSIVESLTKLLKNTKSDQEQQKYIGKKLKTITYGGAALKQTSIYFLLEMGFSVSAYYGMTETCGAATWRVLDLNHTEDVGKFCKFVQYRFQNNELLIAGPILLKRYYNDEEETARVVEDGWLHTGDLGFCDKDGSLHLTGRKKNVIILSNGENVNPEEVEETIGSCEHILESMVYSDGKGICADVYTDNQASSEHFIENYNAIVPTYRQIYKVYYTNEPLPKTGSGKIKRKENK